MITIPGDPAFTAAVSWRTSFSDTVSIAQIAEDQASPDPVREAKTVRGSHSPWETGSSAAMGHKVIFRELKPGTRYIYRVGNGERWTEWYMFRTASSGADPFSFLYLADMQNDIASQCSRVIRQAYSHFPDSRFMIFGGDLVNSSTDDRWQEFFHAGSWILAMVPSMPTPGNHEYSNDPVDKKTRIFSPQWQNIYTMPSNGPSKAFDSRAYYLDYQGVRFISLDSPALGYSSSDMKMLLDWLTTVLESNPHRWSVVFTHYPIFSCSQGRDSESYRDSVKPILEKYGVDLVLQGHDHTYCRGQNTTGKTDKKSNMPMYVVSVTGPKMYGINSSLWADRVATNTQLYQNISVSGNELVFRSFTATGDLYDGFTISKNKKGINSIAELHEIKNIDERLSIPENRRSNYKPEEIQKIESRIKMK